MCVYVIHKFFPTNLIKLEDLRTFPFLSLMHFFKDLKFPLLSKQMLFNEFNFIMGRFIFSPASYGTVCCSADILSSENKQKPEVVLQSP